jgi:adenylate cyclase
VEVDYEAEGLLEGVEGEEARRGRIKLLEQLLDEGFSLEELKRAAAERRLAMLRVERLLQGGKPEYTAQEVAERAGVERELLESIWRALGMPVANDEEPVYTEADVEAARPLARFVEAGVPPERLLEVTRVVSQGTASVAAASGRAFTEALVRPGDNEYDFAARNVQRAEELGPLLAASILNALRLHQLDLVRRAAFGSAELAAGQLPGAEPVTVCFADLVGFTKLGERVAAEELGGVAGRLAALAADVSAAPVRLVKTIGDAAMLVSPEPDPLLKAALDLVAAADRNDDLPHVHAGVTYGDALQRAGDWYGAPVNLASRITSFARPGSVVATEQVRDAAGDGYSWSPMRPQRFKGIRERVALFRVRRSEEA